MITALVIALVAVLAVLARRIARDRRRFVLVAEAEHELRGAFQALALARDARSGPQTAPGPHPASALDPDLERARIALDDLAAARMGRRAAADEDVVRLDRLVWRAATASDLAARRVGGGVHLDWSAGPVAVRANRGRLSQALTNLVANAIEHGGGEVRILGRRTRRGIRVEVRDSGRGHGLKIATKAVRDSGGSISAARAGSGTAVAIDLPVLEIAPDPPAVA